MVCKIGAIFISFVFPQFTSFHSLQVKNTSNKVCCTRYEVHACDALSNYLLGLWAQRVVESTVMLLFFRHDQNKHVGLD